MNATCRLKASDPLPGSIRAAIPHPDGGLIVMTGFPGLETNFDGSAVFVPDHCDDTVAGLRALGAETLTILVERDELDEAGFDLLQETAKGQGITLEYWPIVDFSVPSDAAYRDWSANRARRDDLFKSGGTLAFSCQYGAGRSGLMAALTLMEAGVPSQKAIAIIRGHFAEAVESEDQEAWLAARDGDFQR